MQEQALPLQGCSIGTANGQSGLFTLLFKIHLLLPDTPQFLVDYHDYYRTPRGYHARAVNSGNSWTQTTPLSFMNMPLLTYIEEISPRPVLLIHGEKAHSRYFSQTAYAAAAEPKELVIVPGASHVDLYDRVDVIPFDKMATFFTQHLGS